MKRQWEDFVPENFRINAKVRRELGVTRGRRGKEDYATFCFCLATLEMNDKNKQTNICHTRNPKEA